ncbi:hypothetical protein [Pseudonocardia sp. DLS-67]
MENPTPRHRGSRAAWVLVLLAPVCGELTFSAVGMPIMWIAFPFLVPMYGAGVLLIRELTVRAGGGWPSLVVMGLAYELVEDGLGLQALTSPTMYNASAWGPRVLGLNLTYWESQVGYHIVFSVLIPILLTNLVFPELRQAPYLRRRGTFFVAVTAVAGIAMLRLTFAASEDPGYRAPLPVVVGLVVATVALGVVALRILPRYARAGRGHVDRAARTGSVPAPGVAGTVAGMVTLAYLGLLMPAGHPPAGPAVGEGAFVYLPMTVAAGLAVGILLLIRRWSLSPEMTDRHRIWLAGGALVAHTLFVVLAAVLHMEDTLSTVVAVTTGPITIGVTVLLLARLGAARPVAAKPLPCHPAA